MKPMSLLGQMVSATYGPDHPLAGAPRCTAGKVLCFASKNELGEEAQFICSKEEDDTLIILSDWRAQEGNRHGMAKFLERPLGGTFCVLHIAHLYHEGGPGRAVFQVIPMIKDGEDVYVQREDLAAEPSSHPPMIRGFDSERSAYAMAEVAKMPLSALGVERHGRFLRTRETVLLDLYRDAQDAGEFHATIGEEIDAQAARIAQAKSVAPAPAAVVVQPPAESVAPVVAPAAQPAAVAAPKAVSKKAAKKAAKAAKTAKPKASVVVTDLSQIPTPTTDDRAVVLAEAEQEPAAEPPVPEVTRETSEEVVTAPPTEEVPTPAPAEESTEPQDARSIVIEVLKSRGMDQEEIDARLAAMPAEKLQSFVDALLI